MRVKALHDFTVYQDATCQLLAFKAGQEITGWDAALVVGKHCPVEILEEDPAPDPTPDAIPGHRDPCVDGDVCGGPHCPPEATTHDDTAGDPGGGKPFDPSEHTVAEVLAYAKDHPDVAGQIYAAERAGRARTTILSTLV